MIDQPTLLECRDVWLKYKKQGDGSKSFKSTVVNILKGKRFVEEFWGLREVSFSVSQGETLGILGPNGSGKSSLVKVLSKIFRPDRGKVTIRGKVAALLEVGAGFQRDLTGRENIYLNGSILGLSQGEIRDKFDQIVEFAELWDFIDTPVRHYSSGMYARLGFAVASHIDPDLIIIDEVLSVGDQLFQKKCYEKLNEFRSNGKTIILISHNLAALTELCKRCLWMDSGKIIMDDTTQQVIYAYNRHNFEEQAKRYSGETDRLKSDHGDEKTVRPVTIRDIQILDPSGKRTHTVRTGEPVMIEIKFHASKKTANPVFGIAFQKRDGTLLAGPNTLFDGLPIPHIESDGKIVYSLESLPLLPGTYVLSASIYEESMQFAYDYLDKIYPFQVLEGCTNQKFGIIYLKGQWSVSHE